MGRAQTLPLTPPFATHPTVAPLAPGATLNPTPAGPGVPPLFPAHPATGPLMNPGNGLWDNGEAAMVGADQGGLIDWPSANQTSLDFPGAVNPTVFQYVPTGQTQPEGWTLQTFDGVQYWRLRGYLRSAPLPSNVHQVEDAGFEVIAPLVRDPNKATILVLRTPATTFIGANDGIPPDIGLLHARTGWDHESGVAYDDPTTPGWSANIRLMAANEKLRLAGTMQYNVISARISARLGFRPLRFQLQRNVELSRALRLMFTTLPPVYSPPPPLPPNNVTPWQPPLAAVGQPANNWQVALPAPLACGIEGGSLGAAIGTWAALFFPEDFDGAIGAGGSFSLRAWIGEQAAQVNLGAVSGFTDGLTGFGANEALHYGSLFFGIPQNRNFNQAQLQAWSPFFHASVVRAWKDNFLKRPVYQIISDEDGIASMGSDAVPWVSGVRDFVPYGERTNGLGVKLRWSIVPKNCHTYLKTFQFGVPPTKNIPGWVQNLQTYEDGILSFLPEIVASSAVAQTYTPQTSIVNATEDVYDHYLQPPVGPPPHTNPPPQFPPPPLYPPLHLDVPFSGAVPAAVQRTGKSFGLGTHLAALTVSPTPGLGVYVGSAEGVVSRLVVDPVTNEVVPAAMSETLGTGAWGLALGDVDPNPGLEVVVGTHRGLHVLDGTTLGTLRSRRDLPWELSRPRSLKIADFVPGGPPEVILASEVGVMAVFDLTTLTEIGRRGEAGIAAIEVLQTSGGQATLALLSARGHVVNVRWNPQTGAIDVIAVSPRLNGGPVAMRRCDALTGQPSLAVLMAAVPTAHNESLWILDAVTLAPIHHQITNALDAAGSNAADPSHGGGADLEVRTGGFVLLGADQILSVPFPPGPAVTKVFLGAFPPLLRALDVAIDPLTDRLLVSTMAGYVCWLPMSDLAASQLTANSTGGPGIGRSAGVLNGAPAFCNRTLSATWGMEADLSGPVRTLEVIDQAGSRWSVDANGGVTLRSEVGHNVFNTNPPVSLPSPGPYRTLRKLPGVTTASPVANGVSMNAVNPLKPGFPSLAPAASIRCQTLPYNPVISTTLLGDPAGAWGSLPGTNNLYIHDGFVAFARPGDIADLPQPGPGGSSRQVVWWGADPWDNLLGKGWQNRVQGFYATAATPAPSAITAWWSSTTRANGVLGAFPVLGSEIIGHDLRNQVDFSYSTTDAEALRLFVDPVANAQRVAVMTPGARLIVLQPGVGPADIGGTPLEVDSVTYKALDFGNGGLALATAARPGTTKADLYLGSLSYFAGTTKVNGTQTSVTPAEDNVSAIAWVEYTGNASFGAATLRLKELKLLDGTNGLPKVYGVCGMAVGDIIQTNGSALEIIVGSLDGHLLVFERTASGGFGPLLYQSHVAGAIGAYNSIVIADLDGDGINELYVAGSLGLRRWVQ